VSRKPSIFYAPRHQAISAALELVVTTADYVEDGDIRSFEPGTRFVLKVFTPREPYPERTEWEATGKARGIGRADAELVCILSDVWTDTDWVSEGDELFAVPARAIPEDRSALLRAYYAERRARTSAR